MQTVLDRKTIENAEKEKHNAMINERYRRLLDAVEDQMSAPVEPQQSYAPVFTPEAPVSHDTTPVVEQTPTVTEYAPSTLAASLFTAEKFERLNVEQQPVVAPAPQTQVRTAPKAATSVEARYSLTPLAKVVMAVFTMIVVAMLVFIGLNSHTIQTKKLRLKNLEEQKQELQEKNAEIQRYIQELQTEESIIQRATEAGLLN